MKPPRILIVAGSDSGGGAGIQADIKTVTMLGGHAMTAITAITAQNTLGVDAVMPVPAEMVLAQIDAVMSDIGADAIKIGMLGSAEIIRAVEEALETRRRSFKTVVLDPVMVAKGGAPLIDDDAIVALWSLMGTAQLVTPNIPELASLMGVEIADELSALQAGRELGEATSSAVLVKGGHLDGPDVIDWLINGSDEHRFSSPRIASRHTHGTGCTLSSAVATVLARGASLPQAVADARTFVRSAMLAAPGFGAGHGPMAHWAAATGAMDLNQVTLPATDYAASVAFYRTLGLRQIVDSPDRYARFECPGGATLSIHVEDEGRAGDTLVYLESADLDAWVERLRDRGIAFESLPEDQRWGWREARLRDPAGNRLCLYRAGENRRFPPWRLAE